MTYEPRNEYVEFAKGFTLAGLRTAYGSAMTLVTLPTTIRKFSCDETVLSKWSASEREISDGRIFGEIAGGASGVVAGFLGTYGGGAFYAIKEAMEGNYVPAMVAGSGLAIANGFSLAREALRWPQTRDRFRVVQAERQKRYPLFDDSPFDN